MDNLAKGPEIFGLAQVEAAIVGIVAKHAEFAGKGAKSVDLDDDLFSDLALHDFGIYSVELDIEDKFGVTLRAVDIETSRTPRDLVNATMKVLNHGA